MCLARKLAAQEPELPQSWARELRQVLNTCSNPLCSLGLLGEFRSPRLHGFRTRTGRGNNSSSVKSTVKTQSVLRRPRTRGSRNLWPTSHKRSIRSISSPTASKPWGYRCDEQRLRTSRSQGMTLEDESCSLVRLLHNPRNAALSPEKSNAVVRAHQTLWTFQGMAVLPACRTNSTTNLECRVIR